MLLPWRSTEERETVQQLLALLWFGGSRSAKQGSPIWPAKTIDECRLLAPGGGRLEKRRKRDNKDDYKSLKKYNTTRNLREFLWKVIPEQIENFLQIIFIFL